VSRGVWEELTEAIGDFVHERARRASPPVERWKVVGVDPLIVESLTDDVMLEEGDPDVEVDRGVLKDRPEKGDMVRVHFDGEDWIIGGVVE
jgi:hypothetical protein